jgi:hypothetical protein
VRASLEVADIFRAAGPTYRATHAGHLSLHQLKVMSAIEHCRTAALGGHVGSVTSHAVCCDAVGLNYPDHAFCMMPIAMRA